MNLGKVAKTQQALGEKIVKEYIIVKRGVRYYRISITIVLFFYYHY